MFKNITIKMYSLIIVAFIAITGVIFLASSAVVTYKVSNAQNAWSNYHNNSANRFLALNALNENIGYGGMIQHFKTYTLRKETQYIAKFQASLGSTNAALMQYERSGIDENELKLINDIRTVVRRYSQKFNISKAFSKMNKSSVDIDKITKIDDKPALRAIAELHQISQNILKVDGQTSRLELLNKMRQQFGYGGIIHNYKNFIYQITHTQSGMLRFMRN
ncbi:MAG: hypothetical protein HRU28_16880 [Rhizobiales bacterium]|nr:hypothetical protein [Hyphomicrobiales bacterium]